MKPELFIPLTNGGITVIDFEDFDKPTRYGTVREHKWRKDPDGYSYTNINNKWVKLHNFVLDITTEKGYEIHHKDSQPTNNKKENLEKLKVIRHNAVHRGKTTIGIYQNKQ